MNKAPKPEDEQALKTTLRKPVWEAKGIFSDFRLLAAPMKLIKSWIIKMPASLRSLAGKHCLAAWIETEPGRPPIRVLFLVEEYVKPVFDMDTVLELFPEYFTADELRNLAHVPACKLDTWNPGGEE